VGLGAAALAGFPTVHAQGEGRIVLGQSAALTGAAGQLGVQFQAGAKLAFDQANAHGGIGRRSIEIRALDDGYEPDRCAENTRKLIADDVFALFGYIGTPTSLAALPLFTQARVPFFAPFTGAPGLRKPFTCAPPTTTRPNSWCASSPTWASRASACSTRTTATARPVWTG